VLTIGAIPTVHAEGDANKLVLPSDAAPTNIPPFDFPSGHIKSLVPFTYDMNTKTGQFELNPTGMTDDWFLTYFNHLDQTVAACAYYKAIKAVDDCGPNGELINPITFEKWKKDVKIDKYKADDVEEDVAHFINQVDLNLTRNHHMVSYGPNQLAGYVCNHNGPAATVDDPSGYFPKQPEIDAAIRQIKKNLNLVACVAMEFSSRDTAPGTLPFTKFWIFNPEGKLVSTIDLDGRGPKGMPHVCTACHGGDLVMAPNGDLKAHFLPFDKGNFAFSSKQSEDEHEEAIFRMNRNVYNTEITRTAGNPYGQASSDGSKSITQLIKGWYGDVTKNNTEPHFNAGFVADAWKTVPNGPALYSDIVAHSCRTCHSAMDNFPFEVSPPSLSLMQSLACDDHRMPNAKVTFDRFWLSGQPDELKPGCTRP
jgi:cytochrome c5